MNILAIAEHREQQLRDVSTQLITAAREFSGTSDSQVSLALIGEEDLSLAESLNKEGVSQIYYVPHEQPYNHNVYVKAIEELYESVQPDLLLMPHTVCGWDYAPAAANRLDLPLITDIMSIQQEQPLTLEREVFESKVKEHVEIQETPVALTARPGEWDSTETAGEASVETVSVDLPDAKLRSRVEELVEGTTGDVDISEADYLVSIGRGIQEEENLDLIHDLADALGATISASRPITDNGWLPKNRQVGQSGKTVKPKVYLAIGISGAVQHISGMKSSDTIIAINNDPDAPIFDLADYGIVGDLFDVVPKLIEQFE